MMERFRKKKQLVAILLITIFMFTSLFGSTVFAAKPDKRAPSPPTNLRSTSVTNTSISLAWNASSDNVSIASYNIYRDGILVGNATTNTYTVSGLTSLKSYNFYVKAKDGAGNLSTASNTLSVTTAGSTPTPTATPILTPTPTLTPTSTPTPTTISNKKVVGYYAAWAKYSGYTPDMVDASKLTHINYAFANIGSDLKITLGYPDIDISNFSKLNALKQSYPNLKTIISVGGWSWSGRFSDAALNDSSRTIFANSCVDFIVKYGFDGVDIDWEYPVSGGLSTNSKRPEDKVNFTLLMQKIREKLDARELMDGKQYILTFAGACNNSYVNNIELTKLSQYVDYANIMTYDIHGMWDSYTDFNAPLYTNTDVSPQYKWSVDAGINTWLKAGFPAEKLVMGVPFYGYIYNAVGSANKGLYQTYSGSSSISYENVVGNYLNKIGFIRYFHSESQVPWLFNGSTFISYEDEQSMGLKAQYIKDKGLGGAMIWELSQDPSGILLNSLYNGLE